MSNHFQSDSKLLYFLRTLVFGRVRSLHTELDDQVSPGFDVFTFQSGDQAKQDEGIKILAVTFRGRAEASFQVGGIHVIGKRGITVQDELHVGTIYVFIGHIGRRQDPAAEVGLALLVIGHGHSVAR